MSIKLIYDAPRRHRLLEGGVYIHGGETFSVSEQRAAELLANSDVPLKEAKSSVQQLTRPELDELAGNAGVQNPGDLPNKAAVLAAIETQREAPGEAQQPEGDT